MFSALTLNNATSLDLYPISYIDNRDFSGTPFSGPYGYQWLLYAKAIGIIPSVMFVLNTCLADGFLVSSMLNQPRIALPQAISADLSLLCNLLQGLPGHRLTLPNVPYFFGCVLRLVAERRQHSP